MMNLYLRNTIFFCAIDIFCVDLFMQSHTMILLESDAVIFILHLGTQQKILAEKIVKSRFTPELLF